jgi:glycosyltransferase involved in cell wall biosynthesis
MGSVHFMLLPSASLHSVSIMQAMALGAIPVVTDTIVHGLRRRRRDGIVLNGVRKRDGLGSSPDIEFDDFSPDSSLDANLLAQLTTRVLALLHSPDAYERIRSRAMDRATKDFRESV